MDIVLDSNIFRSDFPLRSKEIEVILDYLIKTNSSIIIPEIILDEISGLYKRELFERIQKSKNSSNNLNLILIDKKKHLTNKEYNIEDELKEYIRFVKTKLNIQDKNIIPYRNEYLPEISKRAIERRKPAGEDGQGFRDILIWLSIKDYCVKSFEKQIVFLGNNSNDFSNKDRTDLHPSLKEECEVLGIKINYHKTIKEFVETHSSKINFITADWLSDNIEGDVAEEILKEEILNHDSSYIMSMIKHKTGLDGDGHYSINYVELYELGEFFVYEKIDNKLIVNIDANFNIGIDYDYYDGPSGPYDFQASLDRYDLQYWHAQHSTDFRVTSYLTLTIVNNTIEEYDIQDVSLY